MGGHRGGCRKGFTAPNAAVPPTQRCIGTGRTCSCGPTSRQPQPLAQEGLIIAGTPSGKWDKEAESARGRGLSRWGGSHGGARAARWMQSAAEDGAATGCAPRVSGAVSDTPGSGASSGAGVQQSPDGAPGVGPGTAGGDSPLFAAQEGNAVAENGWGTDTVPSAADIGGLQGVRGQEAAGSALTPHSPRPPHPPAGLGMLQCCWGRAAWMWGNGSWTSPEWAPCPPPRAHCSVMSLRREKRECFILMSSSGLSKIHQKQESDLLRFGMAVSTRQRWGHSSGPGGGGGGLSPLSGDG